MAGGYLRISHNELGQIPVVVAPGDMFNEVVAIVDELITTHISTAKRQDLTLKLDQLVFSIYEVSEQKWTELNS
jgi:hypothetical protein